MTPYFTAFLLLIWALCIAGLAKAFSKKYFTLPSIHPSVSVKEIIMGLFVLLAGIVYVLNPTFWSGILLFLLVVIVLRISGARLSTYHGPYGYPICLIFIRPPILSRF
jgi:hypothetical protein